MALKIKVFPVVDYLYAFIQTRGLEIVEHAPQILHYTGVSLKDLKVLLKEDKPDLLIIHSKEFYKEIESFHESVWWVYHPVRVEKDLYQTKILWTNSHTLCQAYYQKLGIQADIKVLPRKKKRTRDEIKFASPLGKIKSFWLKFCQMMYWK